MLVGLALLWGCRIRVSRGRELLDARPHFALRGAKPP